MYCDRATWENTKIITFDDSLPVINERLRKCPDQERCFASQKQLPSRVLSVRTTDGTNDSKLVIGSREHTYYVALSYC